MAIRLRQCRLVIAPCLCVALLTWHFFVRDNASASQINHIQVSRTASKLVVPVSPKTQAKLDAMSRFASLVAPVSELSERDWLLDDSDVPELAVHLPDPVVGDLSEESDGVWWPDAASLLVVGVEFLANHIEVGGEVEALEALEAQAAAVHLTNMHTYTRTWPTTEEPAVEPLATLTDTVVPGCEETPNAAGGSLIATNKVAQENRILMLSYELDVLVDGAL